MGAVHEELQSVERIHTGEVNEGQDPTLEQGLLPLRRKQQKKHYLTTRPIPHLLCLSGGWVASRTCEGGRGGGRYF